MVAEIGDKPSNRTVTVNRDAFPAAKQKAGDNKEKHNSSWLGNSKDIAKYAPEGSSWFVARFAEKLRRQYSDREEPRDYEISIPKGAPVTDAMQFAVTNAASECLQLENAQCIKNLYWMQALGASPTRPLSSRFLRHYLSGSGKPMGPPARTLAKLPGVKAMQERTLQNLAQQYRDAPSGTSVSGERKEPSLDYKYMSDPNYIEAYGSDMITASGHFNLSAKFEGQVETRGQRRFLVLDITWGFEDRYHWWKDNPDHNNLKFLSDVGVAKDFDMRTQWTTHKEIPL